MKKTLPIIIAVAVLVGGGSFFGGMKYAESKSPARGARAGQFAAGGAQFQGGAGMMNGTRAGGAGARGGMNGGLASGDILSNDGKTLTIKLRDGGSKIVLLGDSTEISKFVAGLPTDLEVGKSVTVIGKANADGSVTASNIQLRPAAPTPTAK